jgi:MFS family permease
VSARTIRRRFLLLRALRYLPTGLLIPVTVLLLTERGFSLGQIGLVMAAQGLLVLLLELPTGGLADALGRRPVLLVATVIELISVVVLLFAYSLPLLALVWALQGIYRALESGPLDAWYVDAALAADPDADIEGGLSAGGAAIGAAIAGGALLAGGLVALDPLPAIEALAAPLVLSAVLRLVEIGALAALMTEPREPMGLRAVRASVVAVPAVVRDAVRLVRGTGVLLAVVGVEMFWGFGSGSFEMLMPPRLAEVVGDADRAAALMGPTGSAAWLVSAVGAAAIPLVTRRLGAAATAAGLRIVHGLTVIGMALAAGPAGVIAAYLASYAVHGAANPVHFGLLHRQVDGDHRATVLSVNSLMALSSGAIGGIVLGWLADTASVPTAMLVGAAALSAGALLYLPAHRAERRQRAAIASTCYAASATSSRSVASASISMRRTRSRDKPSSSPI